MRNSVFYMLLLCCGCGSISRQSIEKKLVDSQNKFQNHSGLVIYDVEKRKTILDFNGSKYFTPASNIKILTFFGCLNLLGDSVPALKYVESDDSLIFWGSGDPSFLNRKTYTNSRVYDFLKSATQPLYLSTSNFNTTHFGSGWAWDDYNDTYSAERSPFPLYGNLITIVATAGNTLVTPAYFYSFLQLGSVQRKPKATRKEHSNELEFCPAMDGKLYELEVPFKNDSILTLKLLADTLSKNIALVDKVVGKKYKTIYSIPADSLYKVMMQESDNFIAEQLLLVCSGVLSDTLKPEIAIKHLQKNYLSEIQDKLIWKDGSGLSRYNLVTPRAMVEVWKKIYVMRPAERLFPLLATGGKGGTLKNWYNSSKPFIFGKTGTLSNNHNLSGYLITKSGKTLIFSFMNNNYITSTNDIRKNMQEILFHYYEKY